MNFNRLCKLSELITNDLKRKPTIILDPNPEQSYRISGTANDIVVGIDADDWEIPEKLQPFIDETTKEDISDEEKILRIYQKLCRDYTYDDNVLSYIKKNDDETFFLPDAYGRDTDPSWKENRAKHNRRSCFEISRILAKAITEMLKGTGHSRNYDVCIIWDEANTHYFVGIAGNEYYLSLDLDDFTQIKDLTRMKTGLTLEGIKIYEDPSKKFERLIQNANEGKGKIAREHIEEKIEELHGESESSEKDSNDLEMDDVKYLQYTVQILKEEYQLDSAGIYEYLKEIIDTKFGARFRQKVWKEVKNGPGIGTRYTRCLIVSINDTPYIIDVTKDDPSQIFQQYDEKSIEQQKTIPFKKMSREWKNDPYDGR